MGVRMSFENLCNLFDKGVDIWQDRQELFFLIDKLNNQSGGINRVVEVGFHYGGTCRVFEQYILSDKLDDNPFIISIDKDISRQDWDIKASPLPIYLFEGDSKSLEIKEKVLEVIGKAEIDLLYIDGEHSYDGVMSDYLAFGPTVKSGGIVSLNDVVSREVGVHKAFKELKERPELDFLGESIIWTGTGVFRKI